MLPAVRLVVVLVVSAILEGCGSATTSVPSLPGPQVAAHAVGVRVVGAEGEFYNRLTGAPFTPRGNNYLRLACQLLPAGERDLYHSIFNIGLYNPSQIEQALSQMQSSGYNVVRVWLNGCCLGTIGNPAGGLSNEYLANVVDLLVRARAHNLLVVLTTDSVPAFGVTSKYSAPPAVRSSRAPVWIT